MATNSKRDIIGPELTRHRGDNWKFEFDLSLVSDGSAVDLSGHTVVMSVSTERNPTTASYAFQVTGVLSATTGRFSFTPTEGNMDLAVGTYWYDVELELSGAKLTIAKNKLYVVQDIGK